MCIFCNIAQGKDEKTVILYKDEEIVVFRDIRPASTHHYLICPINHIRSAKELTGQHLPLLQRLIEVGRQVLTDQGGDISTARFGFHWPPFHMIEHLHLHVIAPEDQMGLFARGIYRPNSWWFVTADWMINRLQGMPDKIENDT